MLKGRVLLRVSMMRAVAFCIVAVLLLPGAMAATWPFVATAPVDGALSTRSSVLLAGEMAVEDVFAAFGSAHPASLALGDDLAISYCPDRGEGGYAAPGSEEVTGRPSRCPDGEYRGGASLRIASGGFVAQALGGGRGRLDATGVAALGGANLSVNGMPTGPGLFVGGVAVLAVEGDAFALRPIGESASFEVTSGGEVSAFNGSAFTLFVENAASLALNGRDAFVGLPPGASVSFGPAPLRAAEETLSVDSLHGLMRVVVAPEDADRRADVADAFGPLKVVPALLNGALAASSNLTLDGEAQDGFLLLRTSAARVELTGEAWRVAGSASGSIHDHALSPTRSPPAAGPFLVPVVLVALAVVGRSLTTRRVAPRSRRWLGWGVWLVTAFVVVVVGALLSADMLGVNVSSDFPALSMRSRVQLGLLAAGVGALAGLLVGVSAASLTRSVLSWRGRHASTLLPPALGGLAALLLLWSSVPALVSTVARFVRL